MKKGKIWLASIAICLFIVKTGAIIADDIADEKRICEKHQIPLEKYKVPANYGIAPPTGYDSYNPDYPHANTTHWGGCMVLGKYAVVLACPKCIELKDRITAEKADNPTYSPYIRMSRSSHRVT